MSGRPEDDRTEHRARYRSDPEPSATALPTDDTRHRVALLVPMTGYNGAVGKSIANATTMALLDTNAANLRITTYDTATGTRSAAARAIADGNKLILGPLMATMSRRCYAEARPADVPLISFSNDVSVAAADVFVMGHVPGQSITRTVDYARQQGRSQLCGDGPRRRIRRAGRSWRFNSAVARTAAG